MTLRNGRGYNLMVKQVLYGLPIGVSKNCRPIGSWDEAAKGRASVRLLVDGGPSQASRGAGEFRKDAVY